MRVPHFTRETPEPLSAQSKPALTSTKTPTKTPCMFDGSLPEIADLAGLDAAGLVEAARGWARAENAACARKQAVMAEIFACRTGPPAGEHELWWVDPEAAVAAELAAAANISRSMALHQTHRGVALRDRLPAVAALFEAGRIGDQVGARDGGAPT